MDSRSHRGFDADNVQILKNHMKAAIKDDFLNKISRLPYKKFYDDGRIQSDAVWKLSLPYLDGEIPMIVTFPIRRNQPPKLTVVDEKAPDFQPDLETKLRSYDVKNPLSTTDCLHEIHHKFTEYQLELIQENGFIMEDVKNALKQVYEVLRDELEISIVDNQIKWGVRLPVRLPLEQGSEEAMVFLTCKTDFYDLSNSTFEITLLPEVNDFFVHKLGDTKILALPVYDGDQKLVTHIESISQYMDATLQDTWESFQVKTNLIVKLLSLIGQVLGTESLTDVSSLKKLPCDAVFAIEEMEIPLNIIINFNPDFPAKPPVIQFVSVANQFKWTSSNSSNPKLDWHPEIYSAYTAAAKSIITLLQNHLPVFAARAKGRLNRPLRSFNVPPFL